MPTVVDADFRAQLGGLQPILEQAAKRVQPDRLAYSAAKTRPWSSHFGPAASLPSCCFFRCSRRYRMTSAPTGIVRTLLLVLGSSNTGLPSLMAASVDGRERSPDRHHSGVENYITPLQRQAFAGTTSVLSRNTASDSNRLPRAWSSKALPSS